MVAPYTPDKGDIIWLDFNSSSGREIMKHRSAFVISRELFNQHVEMAIIAPITSTIRQIKLEVVLPKNLQTQGAVLIYQLKSLDFAARNARFIERAPTNIIDQVTELAKLIVK